MTITINGSGTVTGITAGGLPDAIITQPELATGVAGTGPAFSAVLSANQSVTSSVTTKLAFATEEFDTNSNYDTSNYRFTPTVAGYYQVTVNIEPAISQAYQYVYIYKNGSAAKRNSSGSSSGTGTIVTATISMNGSTDYLEAYTLIPSTGNISSTSQGTYFQAAMVRGA